MFFLIEFRYNLPNQVGKNNLVNRKMFILFLQEERMK